jgi:hypothetical protein
MGRSEPRRHSVPPGGPQPEPVDEIVSGLRCRLGVGRTFDAPAYHASETLTTN